MDSQADQQGVCVLGAGGVVWHGGVKGWGVGVEMDGVRGWWWRVSKHGKELGG